MADALTSPSGVFRAAPNSRLPGRSSSPARASSPSRRRAPSPLRASSLRDVALSSPRSHLAGKGSPQVFSPFRPEVPAPSLRRSQGLFSRQPLGGRVLNRPVCTSLKFPGSTEEDKQTDRPVAVLEARKEDKETLEQEDDVLITPLEARSSIDRIEIQARESLTKLKHLLYKLKTRRDGEVKSTIMATTTTYSQQATVVDDEQQVFVSQKIEVDLSKPAESVSSPQATADVQTSPPASGFDLASLRNGLEMKIDAVTATRATVTFDDATKTAVVTVTATVRAAELEDTGSFSEKAIAMAARALSRTCIELDEKTQGTAIAAVTAPPAEAKLTSFPAPVVASDAQQKVERALLSSSVVSWQVASPEFGSTPFRPVYLVKLQLLDGSTMEALYKPCMPGDRLLRWKRAPEDWVAYQMGSLLGLDCAPPAVLRSGMKLGKRQFDLGVLVLKPAEVTRLGNTNPLLVSRNPQTMVSDIRILDALLGNAVRQRHSFLATPGGVAEGNSEGVKQFSPVTLGQPMGPRLGQAMHSMWSSVGCKVGSTPLVQVVSQSTLARLKGLSRGMLMDKFGGVLSVEEIETILGKKDHLLAYFEGLARKEGWGNVCI